MTSRTGNEGFSLIEVLVASVILFAGLGAVLKAYSVAIRALDTSADMLASASLVQARMAAVEYQIASGSHALPVDSGNAVINGIEYRWTVRTRLEPVLPDLEVQSAVFEVARVRGGEPHSVACEWPVFHELKPSR